MSRILITGGCSFSSIGENERQTWVNDVETKYGFNKYIHTGMEASGNELITYRLLYAIQESLREGYTDISLGVMWSEIERNDVFTNDFSLDMNTDNGNIIFTDSIHTNAIKINTTSFSDGVYLMNIKSNKTTITRKLVVE